MVRRLSCHSLLLLPLLLLVLQSFLSFTTATSSRPTSFWGFRRATAIANILSPPTALQMERPTATNTSKEMPPAPSSHSAFHPCGFADLMKAERAHQLGTTVCTPRLIREAKGAKLEYVSSCQLPTERGQYVLHAYRYSKDGREVRDQLVT